MRGFTLLELLIVIAILAVLATVVILVINPSEYLKRARDAQRIQDLNTLQGALTLYLIENTNFNNLLHRCTSNNPYNPCKSFCCLDNGTYACLCSNETTSITGTGWIPLDLTQLMGTSPLTKLPIDPVNDNTYYYRFVFSEAFFEIDAVLESEYYINQQNLHAKTGNNPDAYETGTDLTLLGSRSPKLTAAGDFTGDIAQWDGLSWSIFGGGIDHIIYTLAVYNNDLIIGGEIYEAGGVSVNNIAQWDGSSWSALGDGIGIANTLTVYNNKLIAGGSFTSPTNRIAQWDGSSWSALGAGMNDMVLTLISYNNKLIAGGYFTEAGGVSANRIAQWDGSSWSALGAGMDNAVRALIIDTSIYE